MDRYRYIGSRDPLTLTRVELLLNSLPSVPASMQLALNTKAPQTVSQDSLFCSTTSISSGNASSQTLTPVELLSTLTTRLVAESVLLNFDYISMHQRCTCILRSLYVEFSPEIEIYAAETGRKLANENEKFVDGPGNHILIAELHL